MEISKSYYLPRWRSLGVGFMLIIVGLAFSLMGLDLNDSFGDNLQRVLISFKGIGDFLFSLLMFVFKAGFLAAGYMYIKYADGVERARLDGKGFYYREIPKGGGVAKMGIDAGPLTCAPYSKIRDIKYKKTFWAGGQIHLCLDSGMIPLTALGVLTDSEKQEIVNAIKDKIQFAK